MLKYNKSIQSILDNNPDELNNCLLNIDTKLYESCIKNNCDKVIPGLYDILHNNDSFKKIDHYNIWKLCLDNGSYDIIKFLHSKPEYNKNKLELVYIYDNMWNNKDRRIIKEFLTGDLDKVDNIGYYFVVAVIEDFELAKTIQSKYSDNITIGNYECAINWICKRKSIVEFRWIMNIMNKMNIMKKNNMEIKLTENNLYESCKNQKFCIMQSILDRNLKLREQQIIDKCIRISIGVNEIRFVRHLMTFIRSTINNNILDEYIELACVTGCFDVFKYLIELKHTSNKFATKLFKLAVKHGKYHIAKCLVINFPKCYRGNDPQIHYDCRITNDMRLYIEDLLDIKCHEIRLNERFSSIAIKKDNHLNFHVSWYLPPVNSEYWDTLKYIVIEIPKTATCSIMNSFDRVNGFGHVMAKSFPSHVRPKMKTICRNPYDRAVSAYYFAKKGGFNNNIEYQRIMLSYPTFESWVLNGLTKEMTLYNAKEPWAEAYVAQIEYIVDYKRNCIVEKENIGRFETLKEDCKRLFNIDLVLHDNQTVHDHWTSYYKNQSVADRIYELYKEDFEVFGYSKEVNK